MICVLSSLRSAQESGTAVCSWVFPSERTLLNPCVIFRWKDATHGLIAPGRLLGSTDVLRLTNLGLLLVRESPPDVIDVEVLLPVFPLATGGVAHPVQNSQGCLTQVADVRLSHPP